MIGDVRFGEYEGKKGNYNTIVVKDYKIDIHNANFIKDSFDEYFRLSLNKAFNGDKICLDLIGVEYADMAGMSAFSVLDRLSKKNNYGEPFFIVEKGSGLERLMLVSQGFNVVNERSEL